MRLNHPIKGIFFDAGWTLYRPANMNWFFVNKIMEFIEPNTLIKIPQKMQEAAYNLAVKYLDDNHFVLDDFEELKQFENVYSILADNLQLALTKEQINAVAYSKVFDMSNYIFFDDAKPTLETLKAKYRLGVISDCWPSIERILKHGGIENYFDTKTFSCFLGTFKPDKRMYLHALEQMNLPPEQTIFIDDSEENLDGAEKCGIQPVHITIRPDTNKSRKYPCINKLSELFAILHE